MPGEDSRGSAPRSFAERPAVGPVREELGPLLLELGRYLEVGMTGRRSAFSVGDDELTLQFTGMIGQPDHVAARDPAGTAKPPPPACHRR